MLRGALMRTRLGLLLAVAAGVMLGAVFGQPGSGAAAGSATKPKNTTPPTITGTAVVGLKVTTTRGTWTGSPTSFHYAWSRCDTTGACIRIAGATGKSHRVTNSDVGHTLVSTVTASNSAGSTSANSAPTAVVPPSGCPVGAGTMQVTQLAPPSRLEIVRAVATPRVSHSTSTLHVHVTITACNGRPVQGAVVYAVAVPFNQFAAMQATTAADGTAALAEQRLKGFPASSHQNLLAMFIRATKPGDSLLDGVSSRRVFALRFAHH
jgi:hypothetical protein